MNAILVSVPPEVCARIANGEQTLLLMKRIPKLDAPYRVYMYEPKTRYVKFVKGAHTSYGYGSGKIIGSFVCRGMMHPNDSLKLMAEQSYMSEEELDKYAKGKTPYGLRITDVTIFDTPKGLGEFKHPCPQKFVHEYDCACGFKECKYKVPDRVPFECAAEITSSPAIWCYVERS